MSNSSYVEKSRSIKRSVISFASLHKVDPKQVDFEILDLKSYLLVNQSLDMFDLIDNLTEAIKKPFDIFQIYELSLFYAPSKKMRFPVKLKTKNSSYTHIVAELDIPNFPAYYEGYFEELSKEINKRLAYNGFLVNYCNKGFWSSIREVVNTIKHEESK